MMSDLRIINCSENLREIKLLTLGTRDIRGDMISVFRFLKGIDKFHVVTF